jgi:hypothetical protein
MGATAPDRVTRFAADLLDAAAAAGSRESRSAKQQLDHWARLGRSVAEQTDVRRRIDAALAGTLPLADLTPDERLVVNAEVDARIQASVRSTHYGQRLAAEGVTTVALDDFGNLVRHHPDGSTTPLPFAG